MKILIIEDDLTVAKSLKMGLSHDYAVDITSTGKKGIYKAFTNEYDFIILDLMLPDTTGLEVCIELRREKLSIPILILSGKKLIESKVVLLNAGADDYMIKPFSLSELKARIRTLLRRNPEIQDNILTLQCLSVNLNTKNVFFKGKPIKLAKKEFLILCYLIRNKNVPIQRLKIIEHIWEGDPTIDSNTIDVHICNIRKKIGKPDSKKLIKTAHGVGYKFCTN